ncbi:MAG: prepilin-type N-terminal cleavage/methylation domain-containing protein [Candidatus Omnitrophica bacterium]|jgi:prepilin-type N-terminal cleavage/methylation domain-containing protein|nr:prepilin-type N-terminal cleavage/methylation domain-containing protein [Candidatus Omnitrophota bacterium]
MGHTIIGLNAHFNNMKRAFTLLELIIVIVIIGILAVLGLTQYTKVTEKGRSAEARAMMGEIRTIQTSYYLQNGAYATSYSALGLSPPASCASTHYFFYGLATGNSGYCDSGAYVYCRRCTAGGKPPDYAGTQYTLRLCIDDGDWASDSGY